MIPSNVHPRATARTLPRPATRQGRLTSWLVASVAVLAIWLLGSLVDRTGVAYGQTVPAAPQQVSAVGNTAVKRRPQLAADPSSGGVYMVWEEGSASTNATSGSNSNLYYAYRSQTTGNWTPPSPLFNPATVDYSPRWAVTTLVNETHAHIQVDSAGNLHVVYAAWRGSFFPGAYYTVGTATGPGTLSWTAPVRLDMVTYTPPDVGANSYLAAYDATRLFVRDDPAGTPGVKMGYVLWAGNAGNDLRLTRVRYDGTATPPVTLPDTAPISNGVDTSAGPVAVLEIDNNTLQLVYAGTNSQTGNGFWAWPFDLNGGGFPFWRPVAERADIAGANSGDCGASGCLGATAVRDDASNTWVAAHYDVGAAHTIQLTVHDGDPDALAQSVTTLSDPRAGRQPVVVYDLTLPTTNALLVYNQCTYVSTSSCSAKDIYYRVHDGTTWGPANLTGLTSGDQQDLTAVMVGDDLMYAWVGVNQTGSASPTGQHIWFHGVQSP
jgi:hypothetical protein